MNMHYIKMRLKMDDVSTILTLIVALEINKELYLVKQASPYVL